MMTGLTVEEMAREVALDLKDGSYVNLGIGMPTKVAAYVPEGREVVFHSENGIYGMGPPAPPGDEDWDLLDAGKHPVTLVVGGSYVSHADSFAAIRGGHLDVTVMGAYQVSVGGDLANWSTGENIPAVGGAMDLVAGAKVVYVMTMHTTKENHPKLVAECTLPLTGRSVVSRVYTDLGIFEIGEREFVAVGLAEGVDLEQVRTVTGAPVVAGPSCVPLPRGIAQQRS
jgi:3-oxoadipate CoA-transferase, beta subunit